MIKSQKKKILIQELEIEMLELPDKSDSFFIKGIYYKNFKLKNFDRLLKTILSDNEIVQYQLIKNRWRKIQWFSGHLLIKILVRDFILNKLLINFDYNKIDVFYDNEGSPHLSTHLLPNEHNLFMSISHTNEIVFAAISKTKIGIDIENEREFSKLFLQKYFTVKERSYFSHFKKILSNELSINIFYCFLWTLKEATSKMIGEKLPVSLKKVRIEFVEDSLIIFYEDIPMKEIYLFFIDEGSVGSVVQFYNGTNID